MEAITIRDYAPEDFAAVKSLSEQILRLNEGFFPRQHADFFLTDFVEYYVATSSVKKVASVGGRAVGVCFWKFAGEPDDFAAEGDFEEYYRAIEKMRDALSDPREIVEFDARIKVFDATEALIERIQREHPEAKDWCELRLFAVDKDFQGMNIGKRLIDHCKERFGIGEFWLLTDTNCNWKYYERFGFGLLGKETVVDEGNDPFLACDGSVLEVMAYKSDR